MGYRINIKNAYYAKLTKDDPSATAPKIVYGTPTKIPGIQSLGIAPKLQKGELYGEGVPADTKSKTIGYDLDMDYTKIPMSIRADMLGHTYSNGVMDEATSDVAPYIAFGAEIETSDGKSEFVWFYKGQAEELKEKADQSESSTKYSTQSIKISCIPRATDSKLRKFADSSDTGFTATTATNWFTAVPVA